MIMLTSFNSLINVYAINMGSTNYIKPSLSIWLACAAEYVAAANTQLDIQSK